MSDVITNMKVRFGADTKQFKKGMNDGKKAVGQFKKDAGSALEQFANQFGVSLGPLSGVLNKATTATKGLSSGLKGAATSTSVMTKALKLFKVALISTGIGALVVALGALITYFTKTQRGADKVSKVMKAIGAISDVLVDRVSALGESIFKAFSDPQKAIADLWAAIKTNIVNRFEGILQLFSKVGTGMKALWERDWDTLKQTAASATQDIIQITTGLDGEQQNKVAASVRNLTNEIKEEAKAAASLEAQRQKLERREIDFIKTKQRLADEISELILKTRDENIQGQKRLEYITQAQKLQKQLSAEEIAIAATRASILKQQQDLGENMISDDRELAEAEANVNALRKEGNDKLRELVNRYTEMTNKINAQTKAITAQREEITKYISEPLKAKGVDFDLGIQGLETDKLAANLKTGLEPAKNVILDFADTFNSTFEGLAVSFGDNLGKLISGADGFEDFGKIVLASLGDLAIQVGKIAIGSGIAISGIKKALVSLNPAVAIAGGVALVALGSAIKGALSNAASGSGGTYTGNAGVFDTRSATYGVNLATATNTQPVTVHVSGEFVQRGSVSIATINETNQRSKYRG